MKIDRGKRGNYLVVVVSYITDYQHKWDSLALYGVTKREAMGEGSLLADKHRSRWFKAAYKVFPLPEITEEEQK